MHGVNFSKEAKFGFVFLYIALTLYIGSNVISFLHLNIEGDSILALSHYMTLPFLFLAIASNLKYINITKDEKALLFMSILFMALQKICMNKSAGMSFFLNTILEPILLLSLLRLFNDNQKKRLQKYLILFIAIEFVVAIYEYFTGSILFAKDVDAIGTSMGIIEMRSYALHGHPLQNAFLVSIVMTTILSSKLKQSIRYSVFFIGYLSLFCFNTRSSIYFTSVVLIVNIWRDVFMGKQSFGKKMVFVSISCIVISYMLTFIQSHDMGSRLAIRMDSNDDSSYARFVLINVLTQDMSWQDLFLGVPTKIYNSYLIKYSLVAIENSVVNLIMGYGVIYTLLFFYFFYKIFRNITTDRLLLYSLLFIMILLFNTNNALQASTPIMPIAIMSLFAFRAYPPN